jgi:hypothetical protein
VRLAPSLFDHRAPTIFFDYPKELSVQRRGPVLLEPGLNKRLAYRSHWERNSVRAWLH